MKIFLLLFLLMFSALFSGCAETSKDEIGHYTCVSIDSEAGLYKPEELFPGGCTLELEKYSKAWLTLDGQPYYARWKEEDGYLTLDVGGELSVGSIENGICSLHLTDSGLVLLFQREGAVLPEEETPEIQQETALQRFWNGDWYGVWQITEASGVWLDQNGQFFDCFARIRVEADGKASLIFWDELQSFDEPIANVQLVITEGPSGSDSGVAVSREGYFLGSQISETQWSSEPSAFRYDSCLVIENCVYESEEGSFVYHILLRPWGKTWEDIEAEESWLLPFFYYDWYLPMLSTGKSMPDHFEAPAATVIRDIRN